MKLSIPNETAIKFIFDHVRNIIISATVMGSGLFASKITMQPNPHIDFTLCFITTLIGVGLFCLNYLQLIKKTKEVNLSIALPIFAAPIYLSFGILIYQSIWLGNLAQFN